MPKMTGLGKGLDALFSMPIVEEEPKEGDILKNLKITDIEPNRDQARKIFDEEAIQDLSDSIKIYGVIQPIIVTKKDDYYSIIAGERRWRAAKKAGLVEIPAIIRDFDDYENVYDLDEALVPHIHKLIKKSWYVLCYSIGNRVPYDKQRCLSF